MSNLPRYTPEISFGQIVQAAIVATGGIWFAFNVVGDLRVRIADVESNARTEIAVARREADSRILEQSAKMSLLDQAIKVQTKSTDDWRLELREQFKNMNEKLESSNQTLISIKLSLANKVDRKP